jgi:hypothetical protein
VSFSLVLPSLWNSSRIGSRSSDDSCDYDHIAVYPVEHPKLTQREPPLLRVSRPLTNPKPRIGSVGIPGEVRQLFPKEPPKANGQSEKLRFGGLKKLDRVGTHASPAFFETRAQGIRFSDRQRRSISL